jgi:hypothetical protein
VWYSLVQHVSWDDFFYPLLGVLAVVFFQMIWITYPLALANQWLVREILEKPIGQQEQVVRRDGILDRLIAFLKSKI